VVLGVSVEGRQEAEFRPELEMMELVVVVVEQPLSLVVVEAELETLAVVMLLGVEVEVDLEAVVGVLIVVVAVESRLVVVELVVEVVAD